MAQVVQVSVASPPQIEWVSGLCDCFEDARTCCYGFWCCPCLACTVSDQFGENRCLPLCDIFSPAITSAFGVPLCAPPAVLSLRAAMRTRYHIKGTLCQDIAVSCFCGICAWCQMHRELRHRKKAPAVVNVHQQNVVQTPAVFMQPNPGFVQPNPGFVQPNPVFMQPNPVVVQRNPVVVQRNPGVVQPNQRFISVGF